LQERRWLDDDQAQRLRDELLAQALPIRFAGPRAVDIGDLELEVPFVQLDAGSRPDVYDLFRVVAVEGSQAQMMSAFRYLLLDGRGYMEVNVSLVDPVSCAFKFVLDWPERRALFDLMALQGQLLFTTHDLRRDHTASTLSLQIDPRELRPILKFWSKQAGTSPSGG
jgi:hypothetical protein